MQLGKHICRLTIVWFPNSHCGGDTIDPQDAWHGYGTIHPPPPLYGTRRALSNDTLTFEVKVTVRGQGQGNQI